jgi:predicted Fe-Mo cluster-binding NifX family protein
MKKEWFNIVLMALFLITPWPIIALLRQRERHDYIIAIPAVDGQLNAPVSQIFARSPYFFIINLRDNTAKLVENRLRQEQHAVGLRIAHLLIDDKVGVVLVKGHIGPEPFHNLSARKVQIYNLSAVPQSSLTVEQALSLFLKNQLPPLKGPTVPAHYGI